jgi:hypothetical protein
VFTNHSDRNGTIKEIKEEDLKRKEKLPKRTDSTYYLNIHSFVFVDSLGIADLKIFVVDLRKYEKMQRVWLKIKIYRQSASRVII